MKTQQKTQQKLNKSHKPIVAIGNPVLRNTWRNGEFVVKGDVALNLSHAAAGRVGEPLQLQQQYRRQAFQSQLFRRIALGVEATPGKGHTGTASVWQQSDIQVWKTSKAENRTERNKETERLVSCTYKKKYS